MDLSPNTELAWSELEARYTDILQAIEKIGGASENDYALDLLLEEQRRLQRALAAIRARSLRQLSLKLRAALDAVDETDVDCRDLLKSAITDIEGSDDPSLG